MEPNKHFIVARFLGRSPSYQGRHRGRFCARSHLPVRFSATRRSGARCGRLVVVVDDVVVVVG
ncbi:MAG TPA: hypothetical protein VFD36_01920, partial [Kofleriaceae bacterium]|nr:hypothetical protein [Kofleriaceae bacterium]